MDSGSSGDWIRRVGTDEAVFARLVSRYQGPVRGFTAMWAPSRDEADDIAQEVFLAALRSAHTFDPSRDIKNWLLGIARNLTRQAWRRVGRLDARDTLDQVLEQQALAAYQKREREADGRKGAMEQCLGGLPDREKDLFNRYFVAEESSAALAGELRTTEGTVRASISRIRRRLKVCVEGKLQMGTV